MKSIGKGKNLLREREVEVGKEGIKKDTQNRWENQRLCWAGGGLIKFCSTQHILLQIDC